jgi:hypothetical protein
MSSGIALPDILLLQAFLGAPVIAVAVLVVGVRCRSLDKALRWGIALLLITLALAIVLLSAELWVRWPGALGVMVLEFVNLPALASSLVLAPLAIRLARWFWPHVGSDGRKNDGREA